MLTIRVIYISCSDLPVQLGMELVFILKKLQVAMFQSYNLESLSSIYSVFCRLQGDTLLPTIMLISENTITVNSVRDESHGILTSAYAPSGLSSHIKLQDADVNDRAGCCSSSS